MTNYSKNDILSIAKQIYNEAGGKERLLLRMRNYKNVSPASGHIHNYFYVNKDVFDYGDLNATLGLAAIFLDGGDGALKAGEDFVEILCCLAKEGYLIDYTFCDKAFDGFAFQLLAHTWYLFCLDQRILQVCTAEERNIVEDWFYLRAKYMYRDKDGETWATFRPYDNQEIGVGACAILAEMLKNRDFELSKNLYELADSRHIGWEFKNGNLDDTLFYTPIMAKTLYLYAKYRPLPDLLTSENCRLTFEGMLQQQPGSGIFTQYNWTQYGSAPEMMAMGAALFQDGRYKWMANRFLYERLNKRNPRMQYAAGKLTSSSLHTLLPGDEHVELREIICEELKRKDRYDHVWEGLTDNVFHLWYFWDDKIEPEEPRTGSMVLEKHAGCGRWPHDPEPILPDKIIMRSGWKDSDLFAMLNLWGGQNSPSSKTFSHRYPGANEVTALVWGEQFVVSNTDQVSRDINIHRAQLNAFNLKRENEWLSGELVMYNPEGRTFGLYPALEMYNSELRYFESFSNVDSSKSTLYEYYGWTNERTLIQFQGKFLAVFDQSFGATEEVGGTRWHLQGEVTHRSKESLRLKLFDSTLNVLYPHDEKWYEVEITPNERPIPVYQHHADIDLDLIGKGKRIGAVTVFCPGSSKEWSAKTAKVTCSGHPAHPNAIGLYVNETLLGTRLGMYREDYCYDDFKTDAASFVYEKTEKHQCIYFFDGRILRLPLSRYREIQADDNIMQLMQIHCENNMLTIRFKKYCSGRILISL